MTNRRLFTSAQVRNSHRRMVTVTDALCMINQTSSGSHTSRLSMGFLPDEPPERRVRKSSFIGQVRHPRKFTVGGAPRHGVATYSAGTNDIGDGIA